MGFEQYVPNVHFEQIPIKNLVSNQEYQRNLSQLHIKRTAEHFDLYQINRLKSVDAMESTMLSMGSILLRLLQRFQVLAIPPSGAWFMMILFTLKKQVFLQIR